MSVFVNAIFTVSVDTGYPFHLRPFTVRVYVCVSQSVIIFILSLFSLSLFSFILPPPPPPIVRVCVCVRERERGIQNDYSIYNILQVLLYIFVDLVKRGVLTLVGEHTDVKNQQDHSSHCKLSQEWVWLTHKWVWLTHTVHDEEDSRGTEWKSK